MGPGGERCRFVQERLGASDDGSAAELVEAVAALGAISLRYRVGPHTARHTGCPTGALAAFSA